MSRRTGLGVSYSKWQQVRWTHWLSGASRPSYFASAPKRSSTTIVGVLLADSKPPARVLLTHIPLHRPDDTPCGPHRGSPVINQVLVNFLSSQWMWVLLTESA